MGCSPQPDAVLNLRCQQSREQCLPLHALEAGEVFLYLGPFTLTPCVLEAVPCLVGAGGQPEDPQGFPQSSLSPGLSSPNAAMIDRVVGP